MLNGTPVAVFFQRLWIIIFRLYCLASKFPSTMEDPRFLAYIVATNARLKTDEAQRILEIDNLRDTLRSLISHLSREKEILTLGKKIETEARDEIDKAQQAWATSGVGS